MLIDMRLHQTSVNSHRFRKSKGFTLVEMVVVLAIIAILGGAAIYKLTGTLEGAKQDRIPEDLRAIEIALTQYQSRALQVPTTEQGLQALMTRPETEPLPERWIQVMEEIPKDPWGKVYQYEAPAQRSTKAYDLYSFGPDGVKSEDDIGNWKAAAKPKS